MARAKTRIRYAIAVVDNYDYAKHPQEGKDGLRYLTRRSLELRKRDVRAGVARHQLTIDLTKDLGGTHLYANEEGAWLDKLGLHLDELHVVKLRIANAES